MGRAITVARLALHCMYCVAYGTSDRDQDALLGDVNMCVVTCQHGYLIIFSNLPEVTLRPVPAVEDSLDTFSTGYML